MSHADEKEAALAQGELLGEAPLSARWEAFCLARVKGMTNTQAAIEAGFSKATAAQKGSQLNRKVQIRLRIESLQKLVTQATVEKRAEQSSEAMNTLDDHLSQLARIRDAALAEKQFNAASAAEIGRGKALGFHSDRLRPEDLEAMGEEELKSVAAGKPPRLKLA